jgi:hypothetical protein
MGKTTETTEQARLKALPPAQAPITAADVYRFNNPEPLLASNALIGRDIIGTLDNCACVLAFLSDFHARKSGSEMNASAQDGLCSVVEWVLDAVEKQSSELLQGVNHG